MKNQWTFQIRLGAALSAQNYPSGMTAITSVWRSLIGGPKVSDLQRYFAECWEADNATLGLYYTHNYLTPESIVFDIGGYQGEWSQVIARTYDPRIFIFEPVREFRQECDNRLRGNPKITLLPYGLGSRMGYFSIYKNGCATSLYQTGAASEQVLIRDIPTATVEVLGVESVGHARIDLVSINIEGGEYDLFESIFASGLVHRFKNIMVQFHALWPSSYDDRNKVRDALLQTHEEVFCYPFVWEMWRLR
jgi:FkbM family methyltransferase